MKLALLLFFVSVGVFFWMTYTLPTGFQDYPEETVLAAVFKCIPIAALLFMVYSTETSRTWTGHGRLQTNVFLGLLFSMCGDFCLIWRHALFLPGASFFAMAHVFYIIGYKMKPLFLIPIGVVCITGSVLYFIFLLPNLVTVELLVVVGGYGLLLTTMFWRTIVYWQQMQTTASLFAMLGGTAFNLSDCILVLDHVKFVAQVPYASVLIMVTYYAAQLCFALSVAMFEPSRYKRLR